MYSFLCNVLIFFGVNSTYRNLLILHPSKAQTKQVSFPRVRVMWSRSLRQYYEPLRYPIPQTLAFPLRPQGQLPQIVTRLLIGSLSLWPAASPTGNLRPLIAQTPLPCATKAYGQLLRRDLNPLDQSPITAYSQVYV